LSTGQNGGVSVSVSVLFVCLGNICRSPTAHAVFQHRVDQAGLGEQIKVDSCGTSHWHVGEPPDARSSEEAARRGYNMKALRGRQLQPSDFSEFNYILAMDLSNLANMQDLCPPEYAGHLGLFLDFAADVPQDEVPDPYYGGDAGFAGVLDMIEAASDSLLAEIIKSGNLDERS
jgi:low molecular weight protein-tyrosine phosphatase